MVIHRWGVGTDTGLGGTSGKGIAIATYSGGTAHTLAVSGSVVGLVLWSSVGGVTCSSSSMGQSGGSSRVGDGKPSSKKTKSLA